MARLVAYGIILAEIPLLLLKAAKRPFWFDELLTFHVVSQQTFVRLREALSVGVDATPLGYYVLLWFTKLVPLEPQIQLRLLSIAGYSMCLLGVYWFASRRCSAWASTAAVFFITLSPLRHYAIEARSYAVQVGFLAIAAALWQRVEHSRWAQIGFLVFLSLSVAMHHLAVLAIGCFAIAELVMTVAAKRIRWAVWVAMVLASGPFLAGLPFLLQYKQLHAGAALKPAGWGLGVYAYSEYAGLTMELCLAATVFSALTLLTTRGCLTRKIAENDPPTLLAERILILALSGYPVVVAVLSRLAGGVFTARYGLAVIISLGLALAYIVDNFKDSRWGMYLVAGLTFGYLIQFSVGWKTRNADWEDLHGRMQQIQSARAEEPELPIVIADGMFYLTLHQYATTALKGGAVQLVDLPLLKMYGGMAGVDGSNWRLRDFTPVRLDTPASFLGNHTRFFLHSTQSSKNWLVPYLLKQRYRFRLIFEGVGNSFYMVER